MLLKSRQVRAGLAALLLASAGIAGQACAQAATTEDVSATASRVEWGALAELAGGEWRRSDVDQLYRFEWREPGLVLVWKSRLADGSWMDSVVFTRDPASGAITGFMDVLGGRRGTVELAADGTAALVYGGMLPSRTAFSFSDGVVQVQASARLVGASNFRLDRVGPAGGMQLAAAPVEPRAPIVISTPAGSASPTPSANRRLPTRPAVPADATEEETPAADRSGPIVIASADTPAPVFRRAPPRPAGSAAPARIVSGSREDEMQRQVQARRAEVAAQQAAEAERQRLAAIAAAAAAREEADRQRRQREIQRQEEEANAAMWGAVFQGVTMLAETYVQAEADMAYRQNELNMLAAAAQQETADRLAAEQEAQARAQRIREQEHARRVTEAQLAQGRQFEARQQAQNEARGQAEAQQAQDREAAQQRRAAEQAEQQRREAAERRAEADAEALREAEARAAQQRAERERREAERAAAEAHRTRLIEYPEAVVLCELTGPQAQFGNWRCHGPLQMTYAKLDTPQAALPLNQACGGGSPRELGVTGVYRAFGCGFGLHPSGGGAFDHIPEKLGVGFVPGRTMFRCPANSTNNCRSR